LLRTRHHRPYDRAAKQSDECAPPHGRPGSGQGDRSNSHVYSGRGRTESEAMSALGQKQTGAH
jgi:hypothetical protein